MQTVGRNISRAEDGVFLLEKKSNIKFAIEVDKWRNLASSCFLCSCVFVTWSFCFYLQNVYVRVPGGTGIPAALRDVPGPGLEDGMCSSSLAFLFLSKDILSAYEMKWGASL